MGNNTSSRSAISVYSPLDELNKHVPVKALQDLIDEAGGVSTGKRNGTKEELLSGVESLLKESKLSVETINRLTQDYKFAGKISVCWGMPLSWTELSAKSIGYKIKSRYEDDPFVNEIQPRLTQKPAFNFAQWVSDSLLRLEFVYAGKSYEVEDNYKTRTIIPTKRINTYLRLLERTFVVETRASIRESKLVHSTVSNLLGIEIVSMNFTNKDIALLKTHLNAKCKSAKRKRYGGDLDTVFVSASPTLEDLDNSEEYQDKFTDGELKETRLELSYPISENQIIDFSIHVSNQGNIWFMTGVPESVIDYIFETVRKIKFLPSVKKIGLSSGITNSQEDNIQALLISIREKGYGRRFNPRIYNTLGFDKIDEKKWIEVISKFVKLGYLDELFELVCPACHETISIYDSYYDIPLDTVVTCTHCHSEFTVSEQNILLMYSFKDIKIDSDIPQLEYSLLEG